MATQAGWASEKPTVNNTASFEVEDTTAATAALSDAPVDAVVRAASALGGVTPWSMEETSIASIKRATAGFGNSPVKTKYTAAPKETCPINSAMS